VIGRDTRESGTWIEDELARGLTLEGATVVSAGVVPTPAIAYLARTEGFDAGIVISASRQSVRRQRHQGSARRHEAHARNWKASVEKIVAESSWSVPGAS
jgi:phosphoglucosamine mutase